jgi:hypothetical protein
MGTSVGKMAMLNRCGLPRPFLSREKAVAIEIGRTTRMTLQDIIKFSSVVLRPMAPSIDPELTIRMLIVGTAPAFELPPA